MKKKRITSEELISYFSFQETHLWKHYLPQTLFAGGNKNTFCSFTCQDDSPFSAFTNNSLHIGLSQIVSMKGNLSFVPLIGPGC